MKKEFLNKKTLIIFTGGPGTGKSGTADRFLQFLRNNSITKISYDSIKEKNWDEFGFDSEKQKDRLNKWSLEEFYLTMQRAMSSNNTILIEYPFYQRHKQKLWDLIRENGYSAVTIYLYADAETVYQRGIQRDEQDFRHPGHFLSKYHKVTFDSKSLEAETRTIPSCEELIASIAHKEYNIKLGLNIKVDVTDFSTINYEEIYEKIIEYQQNEGLITD